MTDWSEKTAEKLRKRFENQRIQDEKLLEMQRLKRQIGPVLWQEVMNAISVEGNALNSELDQDVISIGKPTSMGELHLIANLTDGVIDCEVRFDAEIGKISWKTSKGDASSMDLAITRDGNMSFGLAKIPYSPTYIARAILGVLVGF